jgi:hypothetical protein
MISINYLDCPGINAALLCISAYCFISYLHKGNTATVEESKESGLIAVRCGPMWLTVAINIELSQLMVWLGLS